MVGVAGFEPATPSSRTLGSHWPLLENASIFVATDDVCPVLFTAFLSRSCPGDALIARAASA